MKTRNRLLTMGSILVLALGQAAVPAAGVQAAGTVALTAMGSLYTQDFDALVSSGSSSTLPMGWALMETGVSADTKYAAGTGSVSTGDTYSFGANGNTERALGGLRSGSVIPSFGAGFTNNTGSAITSLQITYTGELWRLGTVTRIDRIDFQLSTNAASLNSGTWMDYDPLDFNTPNRTGSPGARDGNNSLNQTTVAHTITGLNIAEGDAFWIRWTDFEAVGFDDGLAVDNLSLIALGSTTAESTTTLASSDNPAVFGQAITFTATVSSAGTPVPAGGLVSFYDDTESLGIATTNSSGQATLALSTLTVRSHNITAEYSDGLEVSTSDVLVQVVERANTSLAVMTAPNPSRSGQTVEVVTTVGVLPPGAGTPTGSIQLFDGGEPLANGEPQSLAPDGTARFSTEFSAGEHHLTAIFSGDESFNTSTSPEMIHTVDDPPSVTIDQAIDMPDPINAGPIDFTVVFSEPVTGFDDTAADVVLGGTATGSLSAVIAGGPTAYNVAVSGMTGSGTVTASIPAGAAQDLDGVADPNTISTSTDNTVSYDVDPPETTIDNYPSDPSASSAAPFSFSGTDTISFECSLDAAPFEECVSPQVYTVADSLHTLKVRAKDAAGNVDPIPASYSWAVDTIPPDTRIDTQPPNPSDTANATFEFSGTDPDGTGVTGFQCSLDRAPFAGCASPLTYGSLSSTNHTLEVRAQDAAGNVDPIPASYTWSVNASEPTVLSIVRASANPTTAVTVDFTVTFSEDVSGVDADDFQLTTTGNITDVSILPVSGTATSTYTVSASTGTGAGTLRLILSDNDTILDSLSIPLGGAGTGNGDFTTGEYYIVRPPGAGIYDDADPIWSYTGIWRTNSYGGYHAGGQHVTTALDAAAAFVFEGRQFELTYTAASGRGDVKVYVDGAYLDTIHQYSATFAPQKQWSSPLLSAGAHFVEFTNTTSGAGIDAIEVIASVGVGIYDDDDSAWTFTGNWRTYSYIGYYEGEQHYGLALGDYATFVFEGQQFELIYTAASVRGDVQVYVEDLYLETIHQYSATFAAQRKWSSPRLSPGAHVVKFVNATEGSSISIDAIRVIVFAEAGVYDDSDASWSFTGTWSIPTYSEYYGGEQHITATGNDFATFAFEGSGFELIYTAASMRGEMQVYIDGAPSGSIDQYNESFVAQEGWTSPPLTRGRHVVKFVNAIPGQSISIDAIDIEP